MLAPIPNTVRTDREAMRRWLRERIDTIESGASAVPSVVATGWDVVDRELPGGGLRRGAVHEWFGLDRAEDQPSPRAPAQPWSPPLLILSHLAHRAACAGSSRAWCVWIGSRLWPSPHALVSPGECSDDFPNPAPLARVLLIDPPTAADRLWAIDACLRCPGMVVVADGSAFNTAGTRRLQLAAESTGSLALLARPPNESGVISAACTRWRVSHLPPPAEAPGAAGRGVQRWGLKLFRCKGVSSMVTHERTIVLERSDAGVVVGASPDVVGGSGAAAVAC